MKNTYPHIPYTQKDYKYYDLGDFNPPDDSKEDYIPYIRMSDKSMSNILRALIRCHGKILDTCEFEGYYKNSNLNTVVFRISLPVQYKERFEEMSGFKLQEPVKVVGQ